MKHSNNYQFWGLKGKKMKKDLFNLQLVAATFLLNDYAGCLTSGSDCCVGGGV